ncbi:MAG TPA: DNA repair protein RecN [Kiritimatiellia bacterium]|nr:DNA repair protein RecN [Kiritimatiellia bacterium]HRZ11529.1 DNA repair protein RecN [Kiritimatiellia bacterium]HSA16920.1 DNA repair protein RecN [Kiritimatiellia bacterium]
MLTTLRVKNLALVENVRVEFQPGLNVITGETGAGKSILIGALNLLLGERADHDLIRAGEDACGAEACFRLADASAVDEALESFGLEPCADGQLIVRRIIRASGASQAAINDSPVTLPVLKKVGELLVDMHGPHDHQSLLSPEFQTDLLDAFGHCWDLRAAYEEIHAQLQGLEERVRQIEQNGATAEQIDLLTYRITEIEQAAPVDGEEDKVIEEHRLQGSAQQVLELGGAALNALQDGEGAAFDALAAAQKALDGLSRLAPRAADWRQETGALAGRLQELAADLRRFLEGIEADPARLAWLDERLATYQRLKRKYAPTVTEILQVLERDRGRLHDLKTRGEQLAALGKEIEQARTKRDRAGAALRARRREHAGRLAEAVTRELRALGFSHGAFSVEVREGQPRLSGMDDVDFGFAPNAGEPMRLLRAIASSGEISRVMLATKAVLAAHDRIPVMVFDEIDANVGGEMGSAVGRKLAEVARRHQVLCITHLPQVAACGAAHLAVSKSVRDGRTVTDVRRLDARERVDEVARMLGGRDLTSVTLKHARELLEKSGAAASPP